MLVPIEAEQDGKQYIQQKIAISVSSTPRLPTVMAFSEANLLSSGNSFAVAEATHNCDSKNFEAWCGNGGEEAKKLLTGWIWEFISVDSSHVCLIDETRSKPSDPSWQDMFLSFASAVRFSDSSIFYYVSSNTISKEELSELVETTFWFPFYCLFVAAPESITETLLILQEVAGEQLMDLVQYAQGLVTDAYDLEGLLIWTKQQIVTLDNPF